MPRRDTHTVTRTYLRSARWRWIFLPMFTLGLFVLLGSSAEAKIDIKGDDKFKKAVEGCIAEYERMGGVTGKIAKQLKDSKNNHVIEEGNDWTSSPSDSKKAGDGTGSGSHVRVSPEELEKLKKIIDEIKDKNFCAALLHELWHSADADRGEFDRSKEKSGVPIDEWEAVLVQNVYHNAKKLPPRGAYGEEELPEDVKLPGWVLPPEPAPDKAEPAPEAGAEPGSEEPPPSTESEPATEPPPAPEPSAELTEPPTEEGEEETPATVTMSYEHVVPGEYSEVYATVTARAGVSVQATLSGPGVDSAATQNTTADAGGVANFTWRIVSFGNYTVSGTANGQGFSSGINVY